MGRLSLMIASRPDRSGRRGPRITPRNLRFRGGPRLKGARLAALAAALGVAAMLLVSCGGGDKGAQEEGALPGAVPGAGRVQASGELKLLGDDPPTLDPHLATDATSALYVVEIFGGLVTLDKDLRTIPDIAERWEVSADGTGYTFTLRRDAAFHSGRGVTAQDFKYSIERAADPRTASPTADTYLGDILGVQDKLKGRAQEVRGVQVVDDYTLRITIDAPKMDFLAKLTYPTAFVLDREQVERDPRRWFLRANGTGPFRLQEFRAGERLVLQNNPRYHLGPPLVEKVTFLLAGGSPLTMYENNEIDATGVGLLDIERVRNPREALSREFQEAPSLDTGYIAFNVRQPPFDDLRVRQALAMAIDKETIVKTVLRDATIAAKGVLPPRMPGYNPNLRGIPYDPARARELLRQSRYFGRPELAALTLYAPGVAADPGLSTQAILRMWEDNLGLKVNVQMTEWATFLQDLHRKRYPFFSLGWIADWPDPANFLDIKFHSRSEQNETQYSNPEVDRLLELARTERDMEKRFGLLRQAEEVVVNDVAWIVLFHGKDNLLVKPRVKGLTVVPMVIPRLRYVSVER